MIYSKQFTLDQLAPIAVYSKIKKLYKDEITYLFESANQSEGNYSFICIGARERLQYINEQTIYTDAEAKVHTNDDTPFVFLKNYYKNIDTNRKEDARLAKKKELPPHIKALMKRVAKKNMPSNSFKTTDVTPKGYGPNEDVHPETYKAQSVYDNAHTDVTKKGHSEIEAHKHASGVMKKKHPGFSATRGEGQVYKESESLKEVSKKTLRSYIPKAANSLSNNAQGRAFNISANMDKTNKDMQKHYDQRMTVRMRGIHNATKQLTKEDNDIANMIDKTNPGYAKKIETAKAKIAKKYNSPASRYMSKRKDRLASLSIKESSASDRIAKKLNDMETQKSFMDGKSKIPDYSQRPRNKPYDLSKKVKTVKEAAKKAKEKQIKPETFQDEPTLNNNISKNDSN